MPEVKIVKHINANPEKVWELISDIKKGPEWVTVMKDLVHTTDNPLKEGAVYREFSKVGPKEGETEWRVTTFDPPNIQVHRSRESDMHIDLTMQVMPNDEGTRFLHQTEFTMMPKFRPLGWLLESLFVKRLMSREMHQTVENLKKIAEEG